MVGERWRDEVLHVLRCPDCAAPLALRESEDGLRCERCAARLGDADGVLDLVRDADRTEERAHFERHYAGWRRSAVRRPAEERWRWTHPAKPFNRALLEALGNLEGRRLLLIGNGGSFKELFLLTREPRLLVLSDLSVAGVRAAVTGFELDEHRDRLCCAAMDALDLPVQDGTVDLLYGNAIVHHLPDIDRFLAEAVRVLAPGGRAVFLDDALSPAWQRLKLSVLRPLMRYTHRRSPRSTEDVRATFQGGFREDDLAARIRAAGGEPHFERLDLLFYLWTRAAATIVPARHVQRVLNNEPVARALTRADRALAARFDAVRRNQVRLVWGLAKPSA